MRYDEKSGREKLGSARERMNHAERSKTLRPLQPSARGKQRPARMGAEASRVFHVSPRERHREWSGEPHTYSCRNSYQVKLQDLLNVYFVFSLFPMMQRIYRDTVMGAAYCRAWAQLAVLALCATATSPTTKYISLVRYMDEECKQPDVELVYPTSPDLVNMVCFYDVEFEQYVKYHLNNECAGDMRFELYGANNPSCAGFASESRIVNTGVCLKMTLNGGRTRYVSPKMDDTVDPPALVCSLGVPLRATTRNLIVRSAFVSTSSCDATAAPRAWPIVVYKSTDRCERIENSGSRVVSAGRLTTQLPYGAVWVKLARFRVDVGGNCVDGYVPTVPPTAKPTMAPSAAPSAAPSVAPSAAPSTAPSAAPTLAPTVSAAPTVAPTVAPTHAPTATFAPTSAPTTAPTEAPTSAPSATASLPPTTRAPSSAQTSAPTHTPTTPPENILALDYEYVRVDPELCVTTSATTSRKVTAWDAAALSLRIERWDTSPACSLGAAPPTVVTLNMQPGPCVIGDIGAIDPAVAPLKGWAVAQVWASGAAVIGEEIATSRWWLSTGCLTRDANVVITSLRSTTTSCNQFETNHRRISIFLAPDECAPGTHQTNSLCTECPYGHYCRNGLKIPCNPGTHSSVIGALSCTRCNIEKYDYAPDYGRRFCIGCSTFPSQMGDACTVCAPGKWVNRDLSAADRECSACRAGRLTTTESRPRCDLCGDKMFIGPSIGGATVCAYCPNATIPSLQHDECVDRPTYPPAPMRVQGTKGVLIFVGALAAVVLVTALSVGSTALTLFVREQLRLHKKHELHLDLKYELELEEQMSRAEGEFMESHHM